MPRIAVDGHQVRYRSFGREEGGPPLVLIHGAAGAQYVWLEQRRLSVREVITLDLPGHGGSDPPLPEVSVERYADLVARFLSELGHERFLPVGHSMGGAIALTLAIDHPERVEALVLMATGARLPVSDLVFQALDQGLDSFGELLLSAAYSPRTDPALLRRFATGPLQVDLAQARADFEACASFDVRHRLDEVVVPTLVLAGDQDHLISAGRARQLAAGIPSSRLCWVEGAGHMLMQEMSEEVNDALRRFLLELGERG